MAFVPLFSASEVSCKWNQTVGYLSCLTSCQLSELSRDSSSSYIKLWFHFFLMVWYFLSQSSILWHRKATVGVFLVSCCRISGWLPDLDTAVINTLAQVAVGTSVFISLTSMCRNAVEMSYGSPPPSLLNTFYFFHQTVAQRHLSVV